MLYDADILSEEAVLAWADEKAHADAEERVFLAKVRAGTGLEGLWEGVRSGARVGWRGEGGLCGLLAVMLTLFGRLPAGTPRLAVVRAPRPYEAVLCAGYS